MEFPKPLMTIKELIPLGFTDFELRKIAQSAGFPVAIRVNATAPIKFDTKELYAYLQAKSKVMERR